MTVYMWRSSRPSNVLDNIIVIAVYSLLIKIGTNNPSRNNGVNPFLTGYPWISGILENNFVINGNYFTEKGPECRTNQCFLNLFINSSAGFIEA